MAALLVFLVNTYRENLCRCKRRGDVFLGILAVADDVDFFAAEGIYNIIDALTPLSDAGAYCVNVFVLAENRNLCS